MTTAKFVQPNFTSQDAATYKAAIDAAVAVLARFGGWFAPRAQDSPNMTVRVDAGFTFYSGVLTEVAAQNTGAITAPSTNPRIDRVVVDAVTGAASVVTGVESVSPVAPAVPAGKIPVCQVALATSTTSITNALLTDERVLVAEREMEPLQVQCRLDYTNTTTISLNPFNGNRIPLWDGTRWTYRTITTPPTADNSGIGNFLGSYIYAYWTGSAIALEKSSTAPTTFQGMPTKTGDGTRLLVGIVFTDATGLFKNDSTHRGVVSRWNRYIARLLASGGTLGMTASNTWENVGNLFVRWTGFAGDYVEFISSLTGFNNASAAAFYASVGFNTQSAVSGPYQGNTSPLANTVAGATGLYNGNLSVDGYNYASCMANVSAHTNTTITVAYIQGACLI